jgi:hypothetical protein
MTMPSTLENAAGKTGRAGVPGSWYSTHWSVHIPSPFFTNALPCLRYKSHSTGLGDQGHTFDLHCAERRRTSFWTTWVPLKQSLKFLYRKFQLYLGNSKEGEWPADKREGEASFRGTSFSWPPPWTAEVLSVPTPGCLEGTWTWFLGVLSCKSLPIYPYQRLPGENQGGCKPTREYQWLKKRWVWKM